MSPVKKANKVEIIKIPVNIEPEVFTTSFALNLLRYIRILVQGFTTYKTFNARYPVILCIIGNLTPKRIEGAVVLVN